MPGTTESLLVAEARAACGGSLELGKAVMAGLLPFLAEFGPELWLAESRAALAEMKATLAAALAAAGAAEEMAAELVRLAAQARMCIPRAEARGPVAAPEGPLVSPYDGSRIIPSEIEASLEPFLSGGGRERPRLALWRYVAALVRSTGVGFAASALAVEARLLEPAELWFATIFRALALFLEKAKGVNIAFITAILRDAHPKNGFGHREATLVLTDFLVDERYSAQEIEPLLSFIRGCALLLHPDRTAAFATVLRLAKEFIRLSRSTDERFFGIILKTFLENPHLDLEEWVGEGARIVRVSGGDSKEAVAFFDRSSEASMRIWEAIDVGIPFEKAAPRLGPFISAIAGKPVTLAKSPDEGDNAHAFMTDGETVFVPAYATYVDYREDNYLMLRHGATHECAHIEFGSFAKDEGRFRSVEAFLVGLFPGAWERNQALAASYRLRVTKALERMGYRVRSVRLKKPEELHPMTRFFFLTEFPMLYRDLHNIFEDWRVNAFLYSTYPGYRAEKAKVDGIDLGQTRDLSEFPEESRFIQAFLERLLMGKMKGMVPIGEQAVVEALVDTAESQDPLTLDVYDSAIAAGEALRLILANLALRYPKALAKMRASGNRLDVNLAAMGALMGNRNALLEFELDAARADSADDDSAAAGSATAGSAAAGSATAGSTTVEAGHHPARSRKASSFGKTLRDHGFVEGPDPLAGRHIFTYPEWDLERLAYDREACLLAEFPAGFQLSGVDAPRRRGEAVAGDALRGREAHTAEAVRRAFASIKENLDILERGADDGEDIDFDRAVDCFMDFASGASVDMDFYLRRSKKARDILCALVLDMSPSTSEFVDGRPIFEHERSAAYLMAEAMQSIGDSFGLFSYYDLGSKANIFHVVKDFDEPYDFRTVDSLASMRYAGDGFSRMAPGLRHIMAKMRTREARTKIVFLVTDGLPTYLSSLRDDGESSTRYYVDGREVTSQVAVRVRTFTVATDGYVWADLGKVAEEARLDGIRLFCVTLDKKSVPSLSKVFGDSLIYLDKVSSLPARLVDIFRKMTR